MARPSKAVSGVPLVDFFFVHFLKTGALVKVGQHVAAALRGGARWDWVPNLLLWAALVAGSLCGALAYHRINLTAIWFAAGIALALSAIVAATIHR